MRGEEASDPLPNLCMMAQQQVAAGDEQQRPHASPPGPPGSDLDFSAIVPACGQQALRSLRTSSSEVNCGKIKI
jgi:hypothetical protein